MIGWTTNLTILVALLLTGADNYQQAYEQAAEHGKPLLILVGADWCPGCRTMKQQHVPALQRDGGLKRVVYTSVNSDEKPTLSNRLLRGNAIPQLILFTRGDSGWRRAQLTGVHEPAEIRRFIDRELAAPRDREPDSDRIGQSTGLDPRLAEQTDRHSPERQPSLSGGR
jgi:thioredoxin-like negative regulator of GroEL